MKLSIQRHMGCLKTVYITLPFEKEGQKEMGFPPCCCLLMMPVYHITNLLLGQLLHANIWLLGGQAGGSSQLSTQRQVNHLIRKLFLLQSFLVFLFI